MRDENAMAICQAELNEPNAEVVQLVHQYTSGMLSIVEFIEAVSYQKTRVANINLSGLTDPNTGLHYPTAEEVAAFMAKFDAIPESHDGNS